MIRQLLLLRLLLSLAAVKVFCYQAYHKLQSRSTTSSSSLVSLNSVNRIGHDKYISPSLEARITLGTATIADIDRAFGINEKDYEYLNRPNTKGYVGTILCLDTALLDMELVIAYSYSLLASELGQSPPKPQEIRDVLGSTFYEAMLSLGWTIPLSNIKFVSQLEQKFNEIVSKVIDNPTINIKIKPGVSMFIDSLLNDENDLSVITVLPRELAVKALRKSGLGSMLEGRVNPDNLITPYPDKQTPQNQQSPQQKHIDYQKQQLLEKAGHDQGWHIVRCCALMRTPSVLSVYIGGNRRKMQESKKKGLSVIGIKGLSLDPQALRASDKSIDGLNKLKLDDLYDLIKRALKNSQGPGLQTESIPARVNVITKSVAAPAMDDFRNKDTFADEFGSDLL